MATGRRPWANLDNEWAVSITLDATLINRSCTTLQRHTFPRFPLPSKCRIWVKTSFSAALNEILLFAQRPLSFSRILGSRVLRRWSVMPRTTINTHQFRRRVTNRYKNNSVHCGLILHIRILRHILQGLACLVLVSISRQRYLTNWNIWPVSFYSRTDRTVIY